MSDRTFETKVHVALCDMPMEALNALPPHWTEDKAKYIASQVERPNVKSYRAELIKFLDVAASSGFEFDGVDAADLFKTIFPEEYDARLREVVRANAQTLMPEPEQEVTFKTPVADSDFLTKLRYLLNAGYAVKFSKKLRHYVVKDRDKDHVARDETLSGAVDTAFAYAFSTRPKD